MMANPISSPQYWKPSTFGGQVGFDMVKTASIRGLFCRNMKGPCGHIAFKLPESQHPSSVSLEASLISRPVAAPSSASIITSSEHHHSPLAGQSMTASSATHQKPALMIREVDLVNCLDEDRRTSSSASTGHLTMSSKQQQHCVYQSGT